MHKTIASRDIFRRNAFLCYLQMPIGTDINPHFFSAWYAEEYQRGHPGQITSRDMLTDFVLNGAFQGYFPNPFIRRDLVENDSALGTGVPAETLLNSIAVQKSRSDDKEEPL
jgi:hypothetical protein